MSTDMRIYAYTPVYVCVYMMSLFLYHFKRWRIDETQRSARGANGTSSYPPLLRIVAFESALSPAAFGMSSSLTTLPPPTRPVPPRDESDYQGSLSLSLSPARRLLAPASMGRFAPLASNLRRSSLAT